MKFFENYFLLLILAIGVLILGFAGCAGTPDPELNVIDRTEPESGKAETAAEPAAEEEDKGIPAITTPYDLDSLLLPAIQLDHFRKSVDYFGQFAWDGDYIFPEYLLKIFWIDSGPYREGQGTVLEAGMDTGEGRFLLRRSLLETTPDGGRWWQVEMETEFDAVYFEVLVSPENLPLAIRYSHPETGAPREYTTVIGEEIEQYGMPSDETFYLFTEEMEMDIENGKKYLFSSPEILGEEIIEVPAGRFMTVHIRDEIVGDTTTIADYWISPDVPGSIVKIAYTSPQSEKAYITELTAVTSDASRKIETADILSSSQETGTAGGNEGSAANPVLITLNEPWYGSVGPGGISYYRVQTERPADIYIEVSGHEGDAELIYYGGDAGFTNWTTSTQGYVMNIEDYFVDAGTSLYFTIQDYIDEYSAGEQYTILVYPNYILDPIGIMMKGEIYQEADVLEPGRTYRESLNDTGLNYYQVEMKTGTRLKVTVTGLSDYAELIWFDTAEGGYASAGTEWNRDERIMNVAGLAPGTVCYFYISGDVESMPKGDVFQVQVEEH